MHIGVCRIMLHLLESASLKDKRQVSRSLSARIRNSFNVAVAGVEDHELWQRLTLAVCCVSTDSAHANEMISKVVEFIEETRRDLELLDYETEIMESESGLFVFQLKLAKKLFYRSPVLLATDFVGIVVRRAL
ncbi:MAG TPA: DUF503 domain-containing protein [Dehalococcoidia bacterium]|nr:DUF503 domain-containing protein [Dehalococcoidia bacterium]HIL30517.1 DUF503 domain-containing protein [Dehalococcoidia bacterium]